MSENLNAVSFVRPDSSLIERLKEFTVPELCDGAGFFRSMDWRIKPWMGRTKVVGPALTVDVPSGEGAIVADAILHVQEGDVIVVSGKGNCNYSYWGDHRSICAQMKKAAGVVIDGAFRDLEGCEEVGFPIFAKGLTCGTAGKTGAGAIGVTISCGGVNVHPGDIIAADVNGVCVIRPEEAEGIMERALKKREAQERIIEHMKQTGEVIPKVKMK